ncbi:endonuclease/exonuclease/phosphatase family protein [Streptomyces albidoflavus]|uniref:endonuclease/exonuclease/phosphatase family protein n=1 Tax=Actinomycetes TaxID=1760 RepID=UPI0033F77E72
MQLTLVVQNLGHGGLRTGAGDPEDRWPALAERIGAPAPDVVLLQEANGWGANGHRQLARAMRDLDLDALPLAPSGTGYGTAILYRRETMGTWTAWNTDYADQTLHGFGVAAFDVGLPAPLAFLSAHLDPFTPDRARAEAKLVATRAYRYGPYGIVAGDINYPPAHPDSPAPDYAAMRPYNRASRTRLPSEVGGELVPERRVTEMLAHSGYVDVAAHLHQKTGDPACLRRTGTDDRIDQTWVSEPLTPAIVGYEVLDTPAGASDHHGQAVCLDLDRVETTNLWTYR